MAPSAPKLSQFPLETQLRPSRCPSGTRACTVHEHLAFRSFADASSSKKLQRMKHSLQQKKLQQYKSVLLLFMQKPRPEPPVEPPSLHVPPFTLALDLTLEVLRASQPPSSCNLNQERMATCQLQPHPLPRRLPLPTTCIYNNAQWEAPRQCQHPRF